jgi:hypothetical protein
MYHAFLGPRGLQGTHMDTLKSKNSKSITFTVRGGFFTFWAILAHSVTLTYIPKTVRSFSEGVQNKQSLILSKS